MKISIIQEKVLELFFKFPLRRFHIREISRILGFSPPAISKAVKQLEKGGFVNHTDKKKIVYEVQANSSSTKFRNLKRVHNLKCIYCSGLYDYLVENFSLSPIVLFGSYSKGDDTEKSDIDIFIDSKEKKLRLEDYEKNLGRRINLEFADFTKISKELRDSIINGIVLFGYVS